MIIKQFKLYEWSLVKIDEVYYVTFNLVIIDCKIDGQVNFKGQQHNKDFLILSHTFYFTARLYCLAFTLLKGDRGGTLISAKSIIF